MEMEAFTWRNGSEGVRLDPGPRGRRRKQGRPRGLRGVRGRVWDSGELLSLVTGGHSYSMNLNDQQLNLCFDYNYVKKVVPHAARNRLT